MQKKKSAEINRRHFVISVLVGGSSPSDTAHALEALYPALLRHARLRLRSSPKGAPRYLDLQLVEDVAQEAIARWLDSKDREFRGRAPLQAWMRRAIDYVTAEMVRKDRDVLDNDPYSLDEPWAKG